MSTPIAELSGIALGRDGERYPFKLTIGQPYLSGQDPENWACPVSIEPFHTHLRDIVGGDSFQALCLASRMALDLLRSFVEGGGRLTFDGHEDVPLDSYIPLGRNA
jgi:hypothetical protein